MKLDVTATESNQVIVHRPSITFKVTHRYCRACGLVEPAEPNRSGYPCPRCPKSTRPVMIGCTLTSGGAVIPAWTWGGGLL